MAIPASLKWTRKRAFTLLETLVSLALFGLAIGLLANLSSEYSRVLRFSGDKDQNLIVAQVLESMAKSVTECHEIVQPEVSASDAQVLETWNVQTQISNRLSDWSFQPDQPEIHFTYQLRDGELTRTYGVKESVLIGGLSGFSVSRPSDDAVKLLLSLEDRKRVLTYSLFAVRWVR